MMLPFPLPLMVTFLSVCLLAPGQDDSTSPDAAAASQSAGLSALARAVEASSVADPNRPVYDFTATGTITYFWAGEEVSGPATVRGRTGGQFRLDAMLPSGTRFLSISRGIGSIREPGAEARPLPLHITMNMGVETFPYLDLSTTVNDPQTVVIDLGLTELQGGPAQQVRVRRAYSQGEDPDGTLTRLSTKDYFIEPVSGLLLKTLSMTYPMETLTEEYPREMEFENYSIFSGVKMPALIREKIIGQTTWEFRISDVTFNTGLTDLDFVIP